MFRHFTRIDAIPAARVSAVVLLSPTRRVPDVTVTYTRWVAKPFTNPFNDCELPLENLVILA